MAAAGAGANTDCASMSDRLPTRRLALVGLIPLIFFGVGRLSRLHASTSQSLPTIDERAVDADTSLAAIRSNFSCPLKPPLPAMRTKWLPVASRQSQFDIGGVTPFLILHEPHVGEHWLVAMLRAAKVSVSVAQEKSVRDSTRKWLSTLSASAASRSKPAVNATASAAVGLALTPQSLRVLNHGIGTPKADKTRPVRLITLSRRNRLKHAVSAQTRSTRRALAPLASERFSTYGRRVDAEPASVTVPVGPLRAHLESGVRAYAAFECTAQELASKLETVVPHSTSKKSAGAAVPTGERRNRRRLSASAAAMGTLDAGSLRLELFYEDLLYNTSATMARVLAFLGLGDRPLPASTYPMAAKRAPNSLCVRMSNWPDVCGALHGTIWAADLSRPRQRSVWSDAASLLGLASASGAAGESACACEAGGAGLVLGGAHHKTGTVLLERLLGMYANEARVPFHKPSWERCPWLGRREAGVCVDEHLSAARLRRFWVPPGGAAASLRAPLVHVVREPLETCVSAYQYHLHSSEEWLRVPRKEEETLRNHSLYDSLVGMSWQQVLRTSSPRVGILLECRRSVRDQISQQADAFNMTRGDEQRVFTLRMEATEKDYDGTMWALFAFLGAAHQAWLGHAATRARIGAPTSAQGARGAAQATPPGLDTGALVEAATKFDIARNRQQNDDGHLSSTKLKRHLRGLILNETRVASELAGWREATGYDRQYEKHCKRYGLPYFDEAVSDGFADGARYRRRRSRRRKRRRVR